MKRMFLLLLILELSVVSLGILGSVHAGTPPSDFKVAFIGDQGLEEDSKEVLRLIKDEGAEMVLHQGGFDYTDSPDRWDQQINDILGPDFPYFASIGNHDVAMWPGYQQKLIERLNRIPEAICTGDLGAKSACQYKGLFFILSGIGTMGEGHEIYIRDQLAQDNSVWRICSWHKNQRLMQVGKNGNSTGWGVYERCRLGGAIIATGHSHTYSRTHLMDNFSSRPSISNTSNTLQLEKGKSFVFVSGLGGDSIEAQFRNDAWWASIYAGKRTGEFGALFCTFNVNGQPDHASCYFKDIARRIIDSFTLISRIDSDRVHIPFNKQASTDRETTVKEERKQADPETSGLVYNSGLRGTTSSIVMSGLPGGQTAGVPMSIEFAIAAIEGDKPAYYQAIFVRSDKQGKYDVGLTPGRYWIGPKAKALDPVNYRLGAVSFSEEVAVVRDGMFTQLDLYEIGYAP